jgi:hypothetical protein
VFQIAALSLRIPKDPAFSTRVGQFSFDRWQSYFQIQITFCLRVFYLYTTGSNRGQDEDMKFVLIFATRERYLHLKIGLPSVLKVGFSRKY